jgi:hypothetical protein
VRSRENFHALSYKGELKNLNGDGASYSILFGLHARLHKGTIHSNMSGSPLIVPTAPGHQL